MRQSQLFTKVLREAPADAQALNARLLERAGFVYKNSAGVYSYLPLGLLVIRNIERIIREEMNAIGGQELLMPALVEKKYLDATGRWDVPIGFRVVGSLYRQTGFRGGAQRFALGWTHEEVLTDIASRFIRSYKDLPFAAYQIQTKFRNEPRAKSGVLRGKEFIMKDLYSFHATQADFEHYYVRVKGAYEKVFRRCGLDAFYTVADGGDFTGNETHEFQVVSPVGEDTIFVCSQCRYAVNSNFVKRGTSDAQTLCPQCMIALERKTSIEVGNIFPLGTTYSQAFHVLFTNEKGEQAPVIMGSYGIGVSRLMGTIVELFHDDAGIIWPETVAPFTIHLLELGKASAAPIYDDLRKRGIAVLYDDRRVSHGDKLAVADLIGIPYRAVVSEKTRDQIELMKRGGGKPRLVNREVVYAISF